MWCRHCWFPFKSPKFVTTFSAPLREIERLWISEGGERKKHVVMKRVASWPARCNHRHYLIAPEEIGWAESRWLPMMGKMTLLSLCQSIPYSYLRDQSITQGDRGFLLSRDLCMLRAAVNYTMQDTLSFTGMLCCVLYVMSWIRVDIVFFCRLETWKIMNTAY